MIGILITSAMALAVLLIPARAYRAAEQLDFPPPRQRRIAVITFLLFGAWFALVLAGSLNGFFRTPIPFTVGGLPLSHVNYLIYAPVFVGCLLFVFSKTTRMIIDTLLPHRLIFAETMRVVGGAFLLQYFAGRLPGIFALPAGIGDVFVGVTAPMVGYLYLKMGSRFRAAAIAWNIFGVLELVVATTIGYLTLVVHLFPAEASDGRTATFPIVLIPGFGVPLMMLIHLAALRGLLKRR